MSCATAAGNGALLSVVGAGKAIGARRIPDRRHTVQRRVVGRFYAKVHSKGAFAVGTPLAGSVIGL